MDRSQEISQLEMLDALPEDELSLLENGIEMEDGSLSFDPIHAPFEEVMEEGFYDNLALTLSDEVLRNIALKLKQDIEQDLAAQKVWLADMKMFLDYIGFSLEDKEPDDLSLLTRTFDLTGASAVVRFYAFMRSEFFPLEGPVSLREEKDEDIPSELIQEVKNFCNLYLTDQDTGYYPDSERAISSLGVYGIMFKKTYLTDQGYPLSRFILPEDFIVNIDCSDVLSSTRLTHIIRFTQREIMQKMASGIWRSYEMNFLTSQSDGFQNESDEIQKQKEVYSTPSRFFSYESHVEICLEDYLDFSDPLSSGGIPKPYIITFDPTSSNVYKIVRNWREEDETFSKINYFTKYTYLPWGDDIFGIGLGRLIGSNIITLTVILRQLMDAASFQNFPTFFRKNIPGAKQQETSMTLEPGQSHLIDVGDQSLDSVFMKIPYPGPSEALMRLRESLIEQTRQLANTAETTISDSNQNVPVGTMLAQIEVHNRVQNAIFKSFYSSLTQELSLIYSFLKETDEYKNLIASFGNEEEMPVLTLLPVADASLDSSVQKMAKADAIMKIAKEFPQLHNMRNVLLTVYASLKIQNVDRILIPEEDNEPKSVDPVTENMNAIAGKPLHAFMHQNHDAHIVVHSEIEQDNPSIKAHILEHESMKYFLNMQQRMGINIPWEEANQNPEIENEIALRAAQVSGHGYSGEQEPELSQQQVMLEDIRARERIAQRNSEIDLLKIQTDLEKEKAKIFSSEQIAQLKAEIESLKISVNARKNVL